LALVAVVSGRELIWSSQPGKRPLPDPEKELAEKVAAALLDLE
jgi:hypothetical protein